MFDQGNENTLEPFQSDLKNLAYADGSSAAVVALLDTAQ